MCTTNFSFRHVIPSGLRRVRGKTVVASILAILSLGLAVWLYGLVTNPFSTYRRIDIVLVCPDPTNIHVALGVADLGRITAFVQFHPSIRPECASVSVAAAGLYDVGFFNDSFEEAFPPSTSDNAGRNHVFVTPSEIPPLTNRAEFVITDAVEFLNFSQRRIEILLSSRLGGPSERVPGVQGIDGFDRAGKPPPAVRLNITGHDSWRILQISPVAVISPTMQNTLSFGPFEGELRARITFAIEWLVRWEAILLLIVGTIFGISLALLAESFAKRRSESIGS